MISKIRIQNFKCLRDVEVELGPFNVLIGPNDSGKTSFLEALHWPAKESFSDGEKLTHVWQGKTDSSLKIEMSGQALRPFEYHFESHPSESFTFETLDRNNERVFEVGDQPDINLGNLTSSRNANVSALHQIGLMVRGANQHVTSNILDFVDLLRSARSYQLNPKSMREKSAAPTTPLEASNIVLSRTGDNLAAVLQTIWSGPNPQARIDFESTLTREIPTLKGVFLPPVGQGVYQIEFVLKTNTKHPVTIPASLASDGAILLLGFLVLVHGNAPGILIIEEPENGLHPSRLRMVVDLLRRISTGEIGNHPRQVILTTHSPVLLNSASPEEIKIFRRNELGATEIMAMNRVPHIDRLSKDFAPGDLWSLFGEEELVKGEAR